ncbi:MAG: ribbon-helix-helix protein, CopG family [Cyanobacteria bacterium J06554_11]
MNRLTVTLPDDLLSQLRVSARREGVSASEYIMYAVAQQIEMADEVLTERDLMRERPGSKSADDSGQLPDDEVADIESLT